MAAPLQRLHTLLRDIAQDSLDSQSPVLIALLEKMIHRARQYPTLDLDDILDDAVDHALTTADWQRIIARRAAREAEVTSIPALPALTPGADPTPSVPDPEPLPPDPPARTQVDPQVLDQVRATWAIDDVL